MLPSIYQPEKGKFVLKLFARWILLDEIKLHGKIIKHHEEIRRIQDETISVVKRDRDQIQREFYVVLEALKKAKGVSDAT